MPHKVRSELHLGDCLSVLQSIDAGSVALVYLDPPFFTQKSHHLLTRDRKREFSFEDIWASHKDYAEFLYIRLKAIYRVISQTGAIFFHCDRNAAHIVRSLLDEIFGPEMFRSEIIWHYRRWSNSQKGLLPAHQTIYYYTKSDEYTFNTQWQEYSPSTNIDQILQQRSRDVFGKSIYKRDSFGKVVSDGSKRGVPLSDVWDIPYLNPKAKERTGYPTQKPSLLLERIISISTQKGDTVLDPFCGSGTTLATAILLERNAIGIDISEDAVKLTQERILNPVKSVSPLLMKGRDAYRNVDTSILPLLQGIDYIPVQRNSGIDAILKEGVDGKPTPIRVQRRNETTIEAAYKLYNASKHKGADVMFLIATYSSDGIYPNSCFPKEVVVIDSPGMSISGYISGLKDIN